MVRVLKDAFLVLTDSGGIQEEAPSLGKPVLVMRDNTERPEAIDAGTSRLVGTAIENIVNAANELLDDEKVYASMSHMENPYGNGQASKIIIRRLLEEFESYTAANLEWFQNEEKKFSA